MKFEYVEAAKKYMSEFLNYIHNDVSILDDVFLLCSRLSEFNKEYGYHSRYDSGLARHVIVNEEYVVKWDKEADRIGRFGGCEDEIKKYKEAARDNMAYLLAPITPIKIGELTFYVMPAVDYIGDADIFDYLNEEEFLWVQENLEDIHSENWGWHNGEVMIFDYAFPVG